MNYYFLIIYANKRRYKCLLRSASLVLLCFDGHDWSCAAAAVVAFESIEDLFKIESPLSDNEFMPFADERIVVVWDIVVVWGIIIVLLLLLLFESFLEVLFLSSLDDFRAPNLLSLFAYANIARLNSASPNSGHITSVKYSSEYASSQHMKFDKRCSPDVLMSKSGFCNERAARRLREPLLLLLLLLLLLTTNY